jgi:hypothetical protein
VRACRRCGRSLDPRRRSDARFCSDACRVAAWRASRTAHGRDEPADWFWSSCPADSASVVQSRNWRLPEDVDAFFEAAKRVFPGSREVA